MALFVCLSLFSAEIFIFQANLNLFLRYIFLLHLINLFLLVLLILKDLNDTYKHLKESKFSTGIRATETGL